MNENHGANRSGNWRHLRRPWRDYQDAGRKCDVPALVMWLVSNAEALGLLGPTGGVDHYTLRRACAHWERCSRPCCRADSGAS